MFKERGQVRDMTVMRTRKMKLLRNGAIVAISVAGSSVCAWGQTNQVVNTASVSYADASGGRITSNSNTVVTPILDVTTPPQIEFYVSGNAPGATPTVVGGGCGAYSDQTVSLTPAQAASPGVPLYVMVTDVLANKDEAKRDTITMSVSQGGSTVQLALVETGEDTGRFAGMLQTSLPGGSADQCVLQITGSAGLSGRYGNVSDAVSVSPYNVVFDSVTRELLEGAAITIVDAATGMPATVLGVDGKSTYPSTVVTGRSYADSAGRSYPVPKGAFSFPLLKPGSYRVDVKPAQKYVFPSQSAPDEFADKPVIAGKPVVVAPDASYDRTFTLDALVPFNFDIPLDPTGSSVLVTKSVSVDSATAGDYVQYKVTVENQSETGTIARPSMIDVMPQGLRYQKGSFRINGVKTSDPTVASDGVTMNAALPILKNGANYTLTYVALVTSNAPIGSAVNAVTVRAGGVASNTAKAGIRVDGGLFSDAVTIIGRVVSDSCLATDKAARPVPNVRILLEDGTYVLTDDDGQYHIENVRPGLHVAQMDRNSIPKGYHLTKCGDDTRRGGSDISQFIDARGGALWRADFFLKRDEGVTAPAATTGSGPAPVLLTTPSIMGVAKRSPHRSGIRS
jgi:uncharacterized repeat protein (TIGR01451 family)